MSNNHFDSTILDFIRMHVDEMAQHKQAAKNYSGLIRLGHRAASAMHQLAAELYKAQELESADEIGDAALLVGQLVETWSKWQ